MIGLTAEGSPLRDASEVGDYAGRCFRSTGDDRVGVELEFLVFDRTSAARHVPMDRVERALPPLPGGSRVTFEPGGQLELSGPAGSLAGAIDGLTADVAAARQALARDGLVLAGVGLDPMRPAVRQLQQPRYDAMAEFLGRPYGALMMCSTASIQVNLDLGEQPRTRWERAHLLGPVLTAAFANSPLSRGRPCGWMSGRQAVWEHLDPTRTAPVPVSADPVADWARYLLDARVMLVREDEDRCRAVRDGSTFRDWLGSRERPPTAEDLAYHATTVFPPVRPRGWLEIRFLDAQRTADWPVCVAVTHALISDDRTADAALAAVESCLGPRWRRGSGPERATWAAAAHRGLSDPRLARAADACFRAAIEALPRLGATPALIGEVAAFADRYVTTGRSPAADLMDLVRQPGRRLPAWLTDEGQS
ncbi:ergothioneine biosynthesis glutamate--cysteine ligase EgtA [Nonomuraea diastatica]|uniref:Glutamate--cysteine ligase EgtA n=1 Tax=Nonomuraea diastatica TaxID=1848329 RepID=A0A4R4WN22_9ACTN|nr:ergothioneine biosynthesis glutamate--cysteine ligase EgtA [Nonomuraea diastatica]TDD20101.1 ergothioneine biosynthesis glutamate--cysteine ligase EgtA [Nonomuraea diastatica]